MEINLRNLLWVICFSNKEFVKYYRHRDTTPNSEVVEMDQITNTLKNLDLALMKLILIISI